jgi:SlyX protein
MSDARIDRLEERLAWLERHLTEQDKVMLALSRDVERLQGELRLVRARVASLPSEGAAGASAAEERPPHY